MCSPTVTINQGSGQVDPTSIASVVFDIHFSKPMSGFTASDVVLTGTAGGALSKALSGSGADYTLTVTGMTSPGHGDRQHSRRVSLKTWRATAIRHRPARTTRCCSTRLVRCSSVLRPSRWRRTASRATISVTRTGGSANAVSVDYATVAGGTATAGADYTSTSGTLNWANGDTATKTFTVLILDDNLVEPTETVNLTLSTPTGGAVFG